MRVGIATYVSFKEIIASKERCFFLRNWEGGKKKYYEFNKKDRKEEETEEGRCCFIRNRRSPLAPSWIRCPRAPLMDWLCDPGREKEEAQEKPGWWAKMKLRGASDPEPLFFFHGQFPLPHSEETVRRQKQKHELKDIGYWDVCNVSHWYVFGHLEIYKRKDRGRGSRQETMSGGCSGWSVLFS